MKPEAFDIAKLYPELYKAKPKSPQLVDVPALRVLAISGEGDPNTAPYQQSVEALYAAVYAIKFMPRKSELPEGFTEFVTPALESLWHMKHGETFDAAKRDQWLWDVFLVVPGFITQKLVNEAVAVIAKRKPNPRYADLHIKTLEEKQAVQILHVGSYSKQAADIALMQKFMAQHMLKPSGRHHEIYLSDARRTPDARLKTILRQPIVAKKVLV